MTETTASLPPIATPAERRGLGPITLEKISTVMGVLGLAFLVVVTAVSALNERRTLFREAQEHAQDSAFFLADHAQRLFEVSDIALRSTMIATRALDWDSLEQSKAVWEALRQTNALMPYVSNLWLNDESGRLRMTTLAFPAPHSTATDRPIFAAVKTSDRLVIGERIVSQLTHAPTFMVARQLQSIDGRFRGMVSATLDLSYFTDYWRRLELPNRERIEVVHGGTGDVLVATDGTVEPSNTEVTAFRTASAAAPDAGLFAPGPRLHGFYHRVGDLPLYLVVSFDSAGVIRAWEAWMLRLAPLALAAALALASIMVLGRRQGHREAQASREIARAREALEAANHHLEERVSERTADLQETNEQIQRYTYIISHDLRAPLVNIAGFTSELQDLRTDLFPDGTDRAPTTVAQDFDEAIGFIRSSVDKMDRLISAILKLSREGRRDFRPEAIDLTPLLKSIADGVAYRASKADATVRIEQLPVLTSDRVAVEQIFSNLIENAVKYLRPGVAGQIHVSGERTGGRTIVDVADNGRGIDEKDSERVFELFRRAGPQDQPGEGIGLAHVRALVRRLGGRIALRSRLDEGSVFTVDLPDLDATKLMDGPA